MAFNCIQVFTNATILMRLTCLIGLCCKIHEIHQISPEIHQISWNSCEIYLKSIKTAHWSEDASLSKVDLIWNLVWYLQMKFIVKIWWNLLLKSVQFHEMLWYLWISWNTVDFSEILLNLMDMIKLWISWNPVAFNKVVLNFMKSCETLCIYEIQQISVQIWWTSGGFQIKQIFF